MDKPGDGYRDGIPKQISPEDQNELKEHLRKIIVHVGQRFELNVSEKANEFYEEWYYTLPDSIGGHSRLAKINYIKV